MKNILLFLFAILFWNKQATAQVPRLEMHHIGAGDGDGTLIIAIDSTTAHTITGAVVWDTCVVLIDGQRSKGGREIWRYVRDTISARFPTRLKIDYIVLSHLHIDHYGGLTNLINDAIAGGFSISGVITRRVVPTATITNAGAVIDTCYSNITLNTSIGSRLTSFYKAITSNGIVEPVITVGNNLFHYQNFVNISMQCIVTLGTTYNQKGTGFLTFLPSNGNGTFTAKSENDLSYGWILSFQGFHYTTFGDLAGVNGGSYVDGESYVTDYLETEANDPDYHLCAHKVSHHGSAESTTQRFAADNNIFLAVIQASLRAYGSSRKPLPTQSAIENLLSNPNKTKILYTFIPQNPGVQASYWTYNNLQYYNDITLKVIGGPGYPDSGDKLPISVSQRAKNDDFSYRGPAVISYLNCTKGHNWK